MKFFRIAALLAMSVTLSAQHRPESWRFEQNNAAQKLFGETDGGIAAAQVAFPGNAQLYLQRDRKTFRPAPADFGCGKLVLEARIVPGDQAGSKPVRGHLFVKDKDGLWFQSEREIQIAPGEFQTFSIRIDEAARNLVPVGHAALWSSQYAVGILSAGISVYGHETRTFTLECRNLRFTGERRREPLQIRDWELPESGEKFARIESRFQLGREYFNPFDPDEIKVDFELQSPDGRVGRYPAFYGADFRRELQVTREVLSPVGLPYWALRFTPERPGKYRVRLLVEDRSDGKLQAVESPWREIEITDSARRGFVRVSKQNPAYFEFSNGEFFFPVGLNIHTNIDLRSEFRFGFGHLPDRGTYDYDDYFAACGRSGITAVEIWMASWTCAIEWDAARAFYHGLGRYNLANAWRLDHMLDRAGEHGIHLNLVLDNHGKTAVDSDQEWNDNPFNADAVFAAANGGFLKDAGAFFTDQEARKYNSRRNRYLAARWGADPRILAVELWSEVNLVAAANETLADGSMARWHADVAAEYTAMSQAKHPITTHTSGDWKTTLRYRTLFELPEITHWAGDAYRAMDVHMVDQMRQQAENLNFPKPVLITEYGGASQGGDPGKILADIHAGQWSSIYKRQAGSPFLWWHDFVHVFNYYQHYRGFAEYLAGIDLRDQTFVSDEPPVTLNHPAAPPVCRRLPPPPVEVMAVLREKHGLFRPNPLPPAFRARPECRYESLAVGNRENIYGWVFNRQPMFVYPADPDAYPVADRLAVSPDYLLKPGDYRLRFYDCLSGRVVFDRRISHPGGRIRLPVHPFRFDIAYKLELIP
jgi:hypothetical protein